MLADIRLQLGGTNVVVQRASLFDPTQYELVVVIEDLDSCDLMT